MIEAHDIYKSFGDHQVLKGVSLAAGRGETLVVIGGSGCGKTVLLKLLIGLLKPDSGEILIDGQDITRLGEHRMRILRRRFGMLFQGSALFDSLTVGENVGFALREHTKLPEEKVREKVLEKLSLVGLSGVEEKYPAELSGGMKKRVGLARAIALEPEILLYDEPTTGLDPVMADVINDLIVKMKETLKVTTVVATHDMRSVFRVADRIAVLEDGRIIEEGSPEQIRRSRNQIVSGFLKALEQPS